MSRVRVHGFSISLDGFGTGDYQTLEEPFGHIGQRLHQWMFDAGAFGGTVKYGIVNDMLEHSGHRVGATIMGRNMFGPQRGPWQDDDDWKGWWGDNPPYHHPTFVMTHYPHESIPMEGGTTFHFVQGTPQEVLAIAQETAGDLDICIRGGVHTLRDFFREGLVDEAHIVISPVLAGRGERLWDDLDNFNDLYMVAESIGVGNHTHLRVVRRT
ncbi:MAG: dihydrofolate reductase family protein [Thermomicrobiales bacterium]|nr:dihydrofolate reductase family protein [Thermomicrobiales bacterium]